MLKLLKKLMCKFEENKMVHLSSNKKRRSKAKILKNMNRKGNISVGTRFRVGRSPGVVGEGWWGSEEKNEGGASWERGPAQEGRVRGGGEE